MDDQPEERHSDPADEVLLGGLEKVDIVIADYDPAWPLRFESEHAKIKAALGSRAHAVEHVGSTSVAGLAAKPIVDICVLVADSSDEEAYVPDLEHVGYVLRVREPEWHEHRMFRTRAVTFMSMCSAAAHRRSIECSVSVTGCVSTPMIEISMNGRSETLPQRTGRRCSTMPTRRRR